MTYPIQTEENKKAMLYTAIICGILLLLFIFIKWSAMPPSAPVIQEEIEINLGNDAEGFGTEQPLIKGSPTPIKETIKEAPAVPDNSASDNVKPDDNAEATAAPIIKKDNKPKVQPEKPKVVLPITKPIAPQKPKLTYTGPNTGANGNNPDVDNGFKSQGNNPNKTGDNNSTSGNKDSYGNTPGGSTGGPKVTKGNRKIVKHYKFEGELSKATIYAVIKVSPSGQGKFISFDKGTTNRSQNYASAISSYLNNIQFDKSDEESTVTVQFIFDVN